MPDYKKRTSIVRWKIAAVLLIVTAAGFAAKYYSGPGTFWINNHLAGLFYETFWCLLIAFFACKMPAIRIALLVFSITSVLELLQLWQAPFLTALRSTFIGRTLLGTSFSWLDFPFYVLGCILGWLLIQVLRREHLS